MMGKLGFHERWISLIMKCVSTVSYRVRVNGELTDESTPTRGLRQGDPLSPYLFLICAEGLSSLLNSTEEQGSIKGVLFVKMHRASLICYLRMIHCFFSRLTKGMQIISNMCCNCMRSVLEKL
jgi:hypothetical protein